MNFCKYCNCAIHRYHYQKICEELNDQGLKRIGKNANHILRARLELLDLLFVEEKIPEKTYWTGIYIYVPKFLLRIFKVLDFNYGDKRAHDYLLTNKETIQKLCTLKDKYNFFDTILALDEKIYDLDQLIF